MPCSRLWVSVSILPRPSASAWAIGVSPTTSRIALSAADLTVASGCADVEQIGLRVLDHPEDGKVDVDDVFVAGQHQRFFRHLARCCAARVGPRLAVADLGPVDAGHARPQHRLDRGRQVVVEAGLGRPVVGAEAQHDPDLVGQHAVEAARQPDADDDERRTMRDPGAGCQSRPAAARAGSDPGRGAAAPRSRAAVGRGPRGPGPLPLPRLPPPHGPPPRGPLPHGPPP